MHSVVNCEGTRCGFTTCPRLPATNNNNNMEDWTIAIMDKSWRGTWCARLETTGTSGARVLRRWNRSSNMTPLPVVSLGTGTALPSPLVRAFISQGGLY